MTKPGRQDAQLFLFATMVPNGDGGFTVRPTKPKGEVGTIEAAKILGVSRATMWELRNHPVAGKILKWRFTTPRRGRVLFTTESVLAYLDYTRTIED